MWQIPIDSLRAWDRIVPRSEVYGPKHVDIPCPNPECRRSLVQIELKWSQVEQFWWSIAHCRGCDRKAKLFLMAPAKANSPDAQKAVKAFLFPKPSFTVGLEPEVADVSPIYAEIYGQVQEAESQGLNFLVGMGYRKALEFLIKDYLTKKHPDRREKIQELPLGKCIKNEVRDPKIQSCAERAVWLGNDETHYLREWTDKDIDDLKVLLKLTRHWIAAEILTEEYEQSMTKKK